MFNLKMDFSYYVFSKNTRNTITILKITYLCRFFKI